MVPTRSWYIKGARILDPAANRDEVSDLFVHDGRIAATPAGGPPPNVSVIDATGLVVAPGFIDLHVHLREPGGEDAETIQTGSAAAARGGFTTVVAMPNTNPPLDTPEALSFVMKQAKACGLVNVLPSACLTSNRKGTDLSDMKGLASAGAVAFTDDGSTVADRGLMQRAMALARQLNRPVFDHALDPILAGRGVMHEGLFSGANRLPGIPSAAEAVIVDRDIELARLTGCRVHIQHVSAQSSISSIRNAVSEGLPVTCEVTPHHISLIDADVDKENPSTKVNPPLRSGQDRDAIKQAVADGIVAAFATDHAPHTASSKNSGFLKAPFGMIGLETAVGVTYSLLAKTGLIGLARWIEMWTTGPARVLGMRVPTLEPGEAADIVVLDLNEEWTVDPQAFLSKSRNTAFTGWTLTGQSKFTILNGDLTWNSALSRIDRRK